VTTGALPCSKEEAASLAAIQLRLQECLPSIKLPGSSKFLSHHQQSGANNNSTQNNQVVIFFLLCFFSVGWMDGWMERSVVMFFIYYATLTN
jgi:hypothetical protein